MGQQEIFELLKNKRLSGDEKYFSTQDVRKLLCEKDVSHYTDKISKDLKILWYFGFLELKVGDKRLFRIKNKYL